MKRYQSLTFNGAVIATGNKLGDVQGTGRRIIVDYKLLRHTIENHYPALRPTWVSGIQQVGDILRSN